MTDTAGHRPDDGTAAAQWERDRVLLQRYISRHGRIPAACVYGRLARWAREQRQAKTAGTLSAQQIRALQATPGWSWDGYDQLRDQRWQVRFEQVRAFTAEHARVPREGTPQERTLALWLKTQRITSHEGRLDPHRGELLGGIAVIAAYLHPTSNQDVFEQRMTLLQEYVGEHGTVLMGTDTIVGGIELGLWLRRLEPHRMSGPARHRLEVLPDFTWDVEEFNWQFALRQLRETAAGGLVNESNPWLNPDVAVWRWALRQRTELQRGSLNPHREQVLRHLPGWCWYPPADLDEAMEHDLLRDGVLVLLGQSRLSSQEVLVTEARILPSRPRMLTELQGELGLSREATRQVQLRVRALALHPVTRRQVYTARRLRRVTSQLSVEATAVVAGHAEDLFAAISEAGFAPRVVEHLLREHPHAVQVLFAQVPAGRWGPFRPGQDPGRDLADLGLDAGTVVALAAAGVRTEADVAVAHRRTLLAAVGPDVTDRLTRHVAGAEVHPAAATAPGSGAEVVLGEASLQTRTVNALMRIGCRTLGDAAGLDDDDLGDLRQFGQKSVDDLTRALDRYEVPRGAPAPAAPYRP